MKILILVLSYNKGVFADFLRTQQSTWDANKRPNIDVIYYYGMDKGMPDHYDKQKDLILNCSDEYDMMHWKFKLALDAIDYHKYDLIFRTNSCSYIVKDRLLEVAKKLPLTNCYAGWNCGTWISGAGIFFSPDVLDILRSELTPEPYGAEDVMFGRMLADRITMIDDKSRIDADVEGVDDFSGWHYRFKTSNYEPDRFRDVNNMIKLHEALCKKSD